MCQSIKECTLRPKMYWITDRCIRLREYVPQYVGCTRDMGIWTWVQDDVPEYGRATWFWLWIYVLESWMFMCKILSILYIYMHQSKYVWKRYLILIMNICTGVLDGLCVKFCPFCTFICTRANMSFQNEALNVHQHSGCLHLNTIVHTQM